MANVPETATYDEGVYQLELTDPVVGGASGISNAQAKNLANRTKYLKEHVDDLEAATASAAAQYIADFGKSLSTAGYQKLPSGLIIQWGLVTVAAAGVDTDVTLPIAFPNSGLQIVVSPSSSNTATYPVGARFASVTTARFNSGHSTTVSCRYIAIGH